MNSFSEAQLGVIQSLAECYWDCHFHPNVAIAQEENKDRMRADYVESIIKGLTDPDYWA